MRYITLFPVLFVLILAGCTDSHVPQWMICANDQRLTQVDGNVHVIENPKAGSLTIMDVSTFPPVSVETLENVPCSMIGPPTCVAITPDQKFALVVASQKVNPENLLKQIPDNKLTVVRLEKGNHKVIQTLELGNQAAGVEISPDGKRALVANRSDGSLSLLEIADDGTVSVLETFEVGEEKSFVSHAAFSPDGKYVLVTLQGNDEIALLSLENDRLKTVKKLSVGDGPYCIEFLPCGNFAVVANALDGSVMLLEVSPADVSVVDRIPVGIVVEGIDVSPDGKWLIANCLENNSVPQDHVRRRQTGMVVLLEKQQKTFVTVDVARVGRIPQAAAFTPDSRFVAIGSNEDQDIVFFEIKDGKLAPANVRIPCSGGPATLRTSMWN